MLEIINNNSFTNPRVPQIDQMTTYNSSIPWLISLLFIVSSIAKMWAYRNAVDPRIFPLGVVELGFLVVVLELGLAAWLLLGGQPAAARFVSIFIFLSFAIVNITKVYRGDASCGCFGDFSVSPQISLLLNLICLGMLCSWNAHGREFQRRAIFFVSSIFLILTLTISIYPWSRPTEINDLADEISGEGSFVALQPAKWLGKKFPLERYIDEGETVMAGKWKLVLYDQDCKICDKRLENLQTKHEKSSQLGLIIVRGNLIDEKRKRGRVFVSRLAEQFEWYGSFPVVIYLEDGSVTDWNELN